MDRLSSNTFSITTFGCKVNTYDTGLLQQRLKTAGYVSVSAQEQPRIHLLNTCAVTAEATKEAVRTIRRLKAKDPFCTVVVTGCAAQVDTKAFDNLPGADLVIANSHKGQLEDLLKKHFRGELQQKVFHSNIFKKEELEEGGGIEEGHTRAFLKIQDGCNSFCTYCVIPFARGKSRSIPASQLARSVNELVDQGFSEITLTGVHIGDYEDMLGGQKADLASLIAYLLKHTKAPRFRLGSLEPVELTPQLLELYEDERMCAHFHMSIQAANTNVLAQMKRNYNSLDVEKSLQAVARLRRPSFVGMDVIAGFPTETDDEFEDGYRRLNDLPWTRLHVFPYSERPGTKAAKMADEVGDNRRHMRALRLRTLSSERMEKEAAAQLGSTKRVLVLKKPAQGALGLSNDYWPVNWDFDGKSASSDPHMLAGQEIDVRIQSIDRPSATAGAILRGVMVERSQL